MNPLTELSPEQLRRRTSVKWTQHPPDVLPLWVAEMDVRPPEPVRRAVAETVERGDTGYQSGHGYAEALAPFAEQRWGWDGVDPARSVVVADVMTGVADALQLVTEPGAAVVVNPPVYPPFFAFTELRARRRVELAPLRADGRLDVDGLGEAFARAGRGSAYLLCSPHNPTGVVHTREELIAVAGLAGEHGVRVVVDEVHAPLVLPGATFTAYLDVEGTDDALVVHSASKGWNLAGLKAAVLLGGPATGPDLARLPEIVGHGPSHLGVVAHATALREGGEWLDALVSGLDENRRLLGSLLAQHLPDVRWQPPSGTYLAWLDCAALDLGEDPASAFLERGRVALTSGLPFGPGGEHHARLNLATHPALLTEAVERMGGTASAPRP